MKNKTFVFILFSLFISFFLSAQNVVKKQKNTIVSIVELTPQGKIDPMIYGQMLEDCNDSVIYGGIVDKNGIENKQVSNYINHLSIPVMRWPAGTSIYDYFWEKGVGPLSGREQQKEEIWHGIEYYSFGTDEFLQWCQKFQIEPYINFNMGNCSEDKASLGDAIKWVEYVNGDTISPLGKMRKENGYEKPYHVKYWCIGNENYLPCALHRKETAKEYANQLETWSKGLKTIYPDLSLLGVGHYADWNDTILSTCGKNIDFLTQHFYMTSQIRDKYLINGNNTMFAAVRLEQNLRILIERLKRSNEILGRKDNPIRFSIDEWNNRHSVYKNGKYIFTRQDARRLYDIPPVASFLNTFIRNSPYVGMANYIFPVNGHSLIKATEQGVYATPLYDIFRLYREYMLGYALKVNVQGPGVVGLQTAQLKLEGDVDPRSEQQTYAATYIDAAATIDEDRRITLALTNRSLTNYQYINIKIPQGYRVIEAWIIESRNIQDSNNQKECRILAIKKKIKGKVPLSPCGFVMIRYEPYK